MIYKVLGLMSGSSLDGLDIAYVQLEEVRGVWSYELLSAACIPYDEEWTEALRNAAQYPVGDFLKLHTGYGHYTGKLVAEFIRSHELEHKVHFIASHGHTVFHDPASATTFQLGEGAAIAAETGLPVISDLRAMDVALGGQGAPIVPVGDQLLFGSYAYLLNIGGIANLTVRNGNEMQAFDICPANQALNRLAAAAGMSFDMDGEMAASGTVSAKLLEEAGSAAYYQSYGPKSLSNEAALKLADPILQHTETYALNDLLATMTEHIARQVAAAVRQHPVSDETPQLLATGGGALNRFLVSRIGSLLEDTGVQLVVPGKEVILYKEAIVMALIGTLRWREEANVLHEATGARKDSCGGALWLA